MKGESTAPHPTRILVALEFRADLGSGGPLRLHVLTAIVSI
jgi:hypothetical protein